MQASSTSLRGIVSTSRPGPVLPVLPLLVRALAGLPGIVALPGCIGRRPAFTAT